jgi:GNAT superfamily N-acetyltransferase
LLMPSKRNKKNQRPVAVAAAAPRAMAVNEPKRLVAACNAVEDVFEEFKAFRAYKRDNKGINVGFEYFQSYAKMPADAQAFVFDLLKRNMQAHYNNCNGMGWQDKKKKKELKHADARYIVARDEKSEPVAFCHLRFEVEEGAAVLYVYELQLEERVLRKGLGKFLMMVMELVAWKQGVAKVMLTVFKSNEAALGLYRALKYTPDESDNNDLGNYLDDDPEVDPEAYNAGIGYFIFKKDNPKLKKKR